jgi:hypothetical protein
MLNCAGYRRKRSWPVLVIHPALARMVQGEPHKMFNMKKCLLALCNRRERERELGRIAKE